MDQLGDSLQQGAQEKSFNVLTAKLAKAIYLFEEYTKTINEASGKTNTIQDFQTLINHTAPELVPVLRYLHDQETQQSDEEDDDIDLLEEHDGETDIAAVHHDKEKKIHISGKRKIDDSWL